MWLAQRGTPRFHMCMCALRGREVLSVVQALTVYYLVRVWCPYLFNAFRLLAKPPIRGLFFSESHSLMKTTDVRTSVTGEAKLSGFKYWAKEPGLGSR